MPRAPDGSLVDPVRLCELDTLLRSAVRDLSGRSGVMVLPAVDASAPVVLAHPPGQPSLDAEEVLVAAAAPRSTTWWRGSTLVAPVWSEDEFAGVLLLSGASVGGDDADGRIQRAELYAARAGSIVSDRRPARWAAISPGSLLSELVRRRALCQIPRRQAVRIVVTGPERPVPTEVARCVLTVLETALDNVLEHAGRCGVRVGLLYDDNGVSLVVEDDGPGFDPYATVARIRSAGGALDRTAKLVRDLGGVVEIDSVPGWGSRIRARLPHGPASGVGLPPPRETWVQIAPDTTAGGAHAAPEPALTQREREVRSLVEQGLADKQIATRLQISARTVEKHVGALLRKTGARNRTMLARLSVSGLMESDRS